MFCHDNFCIKFQNWTSIKVCWQYRAGAKDTVSQANPNLLSPQDLLDYEVDSDDEWEEEEPGESLSHSEGVSDQKNSLYCVSEGMYVSEPDCVTWLLQEDEEEGAEAEGGDNDDDEDDDGFFVPHGYLSNDEGALEEEVFLMLFVRLFEIYYILPTSKNAHKSHS